MSPRLAPPALCGLLLGLGCSPAPAGQPADSGVASEASTPADSRGTDTPGVEDAASDGAFADAPAACEDSLRTRAWRSDEATNYWNERYWVTLVLRRDCTYAWHIQFVDPGELPTGTKNCHVHERHEGTWQPDATVLRLSPTSGTKETTDCDDPSKNVAPKAVASDKLSELSGVHTSTWVVDQRMDGERWIVTEHEPGLKPWLTHVFRPAP